MGRPDRRSGIPRMPQNTDARKEMSLGKEPIGDSGARMRWMV